MKEWNFETRAILQGAQYEKNRGAVTAPIHLSTNFKYAEPGVAFAEHDYARAGNPSRDEWESTLAKMEHAEAALAFGSGLAACSALVWLLRPGDHAIVTSGCYGGTYRLFKRFAGHYNIDADFVDTCDLNAVEAAIRPNTRLIMLETPTNPFLTITDLAGVADLARSRNITTAVDNTFLSPYLQRPLKLDIDITWHSSTKYLGGHSDVLGGVVAVNDPDLEQQLRFFQFAVGAVPSPFDCWLLTRSAKTLAVRMRQHSENAIAVARFLARHRAVEQVFYPGLEQHAGHELAKRQQLDPKGNPGFGGMVSATLKSVDTAKELGKRTEIFVLAESLGAVESLINHPATMTHASIPEEERLAMGITDSVVRISVGLEDVEDLLTDLDRALG